MGTNLIGIGNYIRNNKVMGEGGNPIHPNLVEFWDFRNKTNDDEDRNKVVGWKKNILNLYNFAYKGNSGYGLYNTSIDKWNFAVSNSEHTDTNTSRTFTTTVDSIGFCFSIPPHGTGADRVTDAIDSFQFEVKGLVDGSVLEAWSWSESVRVYFKIYSDGIYTYPYSYEHKFAEDDPKEVVGLFLRSAVEDQQNSPITIKLIPDKYEGALVLDGVDDFGRNSNFPQLKDYTVICKREHIELVNNTALLSKRYETYGAFTLEHTDTVPEYKEYSFGTNTKVSKFVDDKITWQTATSYNGKNIVRGSGYDSTLFLLGKLFQSDDYPTAKAAVYYIAIYDRSLTQKEINDEIRRYEGKTSWRDDMVLHWEFGNKTNSDYTTSSGPVSNPIIEDLSGNGHHGSLKNFAFEGTSGFGYYPVIFGSNKTWKNNGYTIDMATYSYTKIKINKLSTASAIVYTYITDDNGEIINSSVIPSFKIKVTGIPDNATVIYKYLKENGMYVSSQELTNGVNTLPMSYIPTENLVGNRNFIGFLATKANVNEEVDVTIEILPDPQYNNYLVFDGVDDYVFVDNLEPLTDYTIVMDRKWIGIDTSRQNCLVSKRMTADNYGAIYAEVSNASGAYGCRSFSGAQIIVTPADDIVYVTRDSYNGIAKLVYGDLPDSTHMSLGSNYTVAPFQHANTAIRTVVLFNRTLSKEEIQEVKSELFYENLINNSFTEQSVQNYQIAVYRYKQKLEKGKWYKLTFCYTKPDNITSITAFQDNGYTRITDGSIINSTEPYTVKSIVFQCRKSSISDANDSVLTFYQLPQREFGSTIHWCIVTEAHVDESLVEGWNFANNYNDSDGKNKLVGVKGNELVLRNFAYEGMSGWNGYDVVFGAGKTWLNIRTSSSDFIGTYNGSNIHITRMGFGGALQSTYVKLGGEITSNNGEIPAFKMKIEGLENKFMIYYYYLKDSLATQTSFIKITEDGVYDIPKSFAATTNLIFDNVWVGFVPIRNSGDTTQYYDCDLTIEVLPSLDGCIVTDGIDDYMECSTLPTLYPYYTFIYKRKWLSRDPGKFHYFLSKGGKTQPIGIEHYVANPGVPDYETIVNAGVYNRLPISNDNINFMSDAYYNSFELKKGATSDADMSLLLGGLRDSAFTNSAIYWLYIYNRTLTNDEIKKEIKRIEDKYYE